MEGLGTRDVLGTDVLLMGELFGDTAGSASFFRNVSPTSETIHRLKGRA